MQQQIEMLKFYIENHNLNTPKIKFSKYTTKTSTKKVATQRRWTSSEQVIEWLFAFNSWDIFKRISTYRWLCRCMYVRATYLSWFILGIKFGFAAKPFITGAYNSSYSHKETVWLSGWVPKLNENKRKPKFVEYDFHCAYYISWFMFQYASICMYINISSCTYWEQINFCRTVFFFVFLVCLFWYKISLIFCCCLEIRIPLSND